MSEKVTHWRYDFSDWEVRSERVRVTDEIREIVRSELKRAFEYFAAIFFMLSRSGPGDKKLYLRWILMDKHGLFATKNPVEVTMNSYDFFFTLVAISPGAAPIPSRAIREILKEIRAGLDDVESVLPE